MMKASSTIIPPILHEFKDQLRDASSTLFVIQILKNSLGSRNEKTLAALNLLSRQTDEVGDVKSMAKGFEMMKGEANDEVKLAHARLLLHHDARAKAERILDEIPSGTRRPAAEFGLRGMCLVKTDMASARNLWRQGKARGDETSAVNLAASSSASAAVEEFTALLETYPNNLAVLNGARRFDRVLEILDREEERDAVSSERKARFAQALIGVAIGASAEKFSVTSEGLFRSAEKYLLGVRGVKPVYALELARCYGSYGELLAEWENREGEAEKLRRKSLDIVNGSEAVTAMPSFAYYLEGWRIDK